jgi:phosphatidylcholine synthase
MPAGVSLGLLVVFSLLTFVPTRYIYATQRGPLSGLTNWLALVWAGLVIWMLCLMPDTPPTAGWDGPDGFHLLVILSLLFPVYYLLASWTISFRIWRKKAAREAAASRAVPQPELP